MKRGKIIFIHGKNSKPEPGKHRQLLLKSLLGAWNKLPVAEQCGAFDEDDFLLCAWSDLLYPEYEDSAIFDQAIDVMLQRNETAADVGLCAWIRHAGLEIKRAIYNAMDALPILIKLVPTRHVEFMLQGALEYMENQGGVGDAILDRLQHCLTYELGSDNRLLIIGHSLGSVVAFDYLTARGDTLGERKLDLLTIGSPLGLRFTQDRLLGKMEHFPDRIRYWRNYSAHGDMVSLDRTLADDFEPMVTRGLVAEIQDTIEIKNWYRDAVRGFNPHKSYAYLANPVVAQAIADWVFENWKGDGT